VREVERSLVLEVAFDSIHRSTRHKSGLAMRFPRISRIRTDKPAHEADRVETLLGMAT
jgi:DNA ligase 1